MNYELMSNSIFWGDKFVIAGKIDCPIYILERLSWRGDFFINMQISKNQSCPEQLKNVIGDLTFLYN